MYENSSFNTVSADFHSQNNDIIVNFLNIDNKADFNYFLKNSIEFNMSLMIILKNNKK